MGRILFVAFVATFVAALAVVVGMPLSAQETAPASGPRESMAARFTAMDTDHDGKLSKAEWIAGGRSERGFDMMDADHDGFLTMDEIKAGREKMRAMREAKSN
ncbi:MAG: EF-hand domain-containing protein [Janthinobacterium lividum]